MVKCGEDDDSYTFSCEGNVKDYNAAQINCNGKNTPFIYLYTGPAGGDTDPHVTDMYNRLIKMGFPADKTALSYNETGGHHTNYWCCYFSEFLSALAFRSVEPLQTKK